MTKENLRDLWATEPFRPFVIHMVDGKAVEIPHPDHLFFLPDSEMIFVVGQEQGRRRFRFLTPEQIASVER
jgi:hypothetical protein